MVKDELKQIVRVTKSFRIGKVQTNKPRLMVITLENEEMKWEVLREARMLRNRVAWPRVYISPDKTWKEREASKKLREELASRRERGENLVIRNNKIVPGKPREAEETMEVTGRRGERGARDTRSTQASEQRTSAPETVNRQETESGAPAHTSDADTNRPSGANPRGREPRPEGEETNHEAEHETSTPSVNARSDDTHRSHARVVTRSD